MVSFCPDPSALQDVPFLQFKTDFDIDGLLAVSIGLWRCSQQASSGRIAAYHRSNSDVR